MQTQTFLTGSTRKELVQAICLIRRATHLPVTSGPFDEQIARLWSASGRYVESLRGVIEGNLRRAIGKASGFPPETVRIRAVSFVQVLCKNVVKRFR